MLSLSLICFCLAITQSIAYECPEKNGLFKDPTNPHRYYDCTNGEAFPFTCPEDLVFDESIKNCNYASNVKTLSPQTNPTTSHTIEVTSHRPEVSTHGSSLDCTGKTGFFKDSTNPHIFHECVNGKDEVFHCPDNLVFNGVACDFDAKPSEHGSTNKPNVDCVGKTGFFKDPIDPHKFHECVNGKDEVFHCPENLIFDEAKSTCNYDSNGVTKLPEHGSTGKSSADCAGKTGFFKDPTDPHKFHECVNGVDEVFICPEHLIFNEAKSVCDFDPNAGTGIPAVQTPNSHNTPTPVPTGPPQSEGTRQRHTPPPSF